MSPRNRKELPQTTDDGLRVPGVIVRSKQGRDRYRTFAVIAVDEQNSIAPLVVADGRLHPVSQRKHKNPRHLELCAVPVESDRKRLLNGADDVEIAEICQRYEKDRENALFPLDKKAENDL